MKFRFGLLPRVVLAIGLGVGCGFFFPEWATRIALTFNDIFGQFLSFVIPLLILGLVAPGIADLGKNAGWLLAVTAALAYAFTLFSGFGTYLVGRAVFPALLEGSQAVLPDDAGAALTPYFTVQMPPLFGVMSALVLAFVLGLGMAYTHSVKLKGVMDEFKGIIERVIGSVIIPLLPFYIFGIFLSMTRSGQVAGVLGVFVKLIAVIFCMTVVLLLVQFSVAGLAARKNPLRMLRTMLAAYVTALGTQSSAATIPVTLAQTLNYGRKDGEWVQNRYGGNTNLDAIEFFKHFNSVIRGTYPGIMTIAEESTAWPNVTGKIGSDSLGFTFKWNMGWMHDFCEYMKLDPYFRKNDHHALTFAMSYNDAEDYILPLSHDEVVHLKCSMVNKMPGYKVDKYANLRVGYTYMLGHSGKKLLFMGQEFGQEREWSEARELDWFLLQNELNQGLQDYVAELLKLYRKYPCMYEIDNSWDGFEWINADDADRSTYSFIRKTSGEKTKRLLFVLNMTPVERKDYCVGVPEKKKYKLVLNSAEKRFGGSGEELKTDYTATAEPSDYKPYRITFDLPAYGALVFAF